jgi:hypothetical protein
MIATWAMALVFVVVIPLLALIDCASTDRHRGSRVLIVVLLLITWSLGGLVYALFFAGWRWLRVFTLCCVLGLLILALLSTASCVIGAPRASKLKREQRQSELELAYAAFKPDTATTDAVGPVTALLRVGSSASLAEWTMAGLDHGSARPVEQRVQHVAAEPESGRVFALTDHEFGVVSPSTGNFSEIEIDPALDGDFSWPRGVASVGSSGPVVVMTSHVVTRFFTYDPATADWQQLHAEHRGLPVAGLAWLDATESLYAVARDNRSLLLDQVHRFNLQGALTGTVNLDPPVPVPNTSRPRLQLQAAGGSLVLILPAEPRRDGPAEACVLAIDPGSGRVSRARLPAEAESP